MATCTPSLREALNNTISSGRFADTKIILFSRRDASGAITKPRALYANSHVLKSVQHFGDVLSGTYAESEPRNFYEPIDEDEQADGYDYYSDSDLEDDDDAVNATGKALKKPVILKSNSLDPLGVSTNDKTALPIYGEWDESSGKGMIVKIGDIAFITFQAFIMYLYTGQIEFAPYGSDENRRSRSTEIVSPSDDSIPRPSPKSIYRLADKYDIPQLKRLALESIKHGLDQCDTVEEVFNDFSSKHEAVLTLHVNHLASVLSRADQDSAKLLCERIDENVDHYASGALDHAVDAITLLWKLSKTGGRPLPVALGEESVKLEDPEDPEKPANLPTPVNWTRVEIALIRSIRKGVFFDRKYWTKYSKATGELRPIYISSVVTGEQMRHINDLVKMYREEERSTVGEGTEDSDCEENPEEASGSPSEAQDDEGGETEPASLPVLTAGSLASWRALFFYMCTDVIQFAPLRSQGADVRALFVRDETTPDKPPPCSPKVVYSLATALEIKVLRDLAFNDIKSKVTDMNAVTELFSGFTSQQDDIAKMQCDLLYLKFNDETTTTEGEKAIGSMMGGKLAHRAGALKLGLREGLLGGALLRCPRNDCDLRNNPISYRSLGSNARCPRNHPKNPYLVCNGCGSYRSDSGWTSCQNCKRQFK